MKMHPVNICVSVYNLGVATKTQVFHQVVNFSSHALLSQLDSNNIYIQLILNIKKTYFIGLAKVPLCISISDRINTGNFRNMEFNLERISMAFNDTEIIKVQLKSP
jgi:hypothetical protein